MNLSPKNKTELIQSLQKQKDFKVESVLNGTGPDLVTKMKDLKSGQYTVIVIKD